MPSSRSSSRSLIDPYGIYGTRTENRLRAARRRRQMQNVLLVLLACAALGGFIALAKWKRVRVVTTHNRTELNSLVGVAPVWVAPQPNAPGALLIAGKDGRLLRVDEVENPFPPVVLLEADFPLRAPAVAGDIAYVPSENGSLYAVSWRERKFIWRQTFDASLTARPVVLVRNGKVIVIAGCDSGLIMAMDGASGQVLWRARVPAPLGNGMAVTEAGGASRLLVPLLGGTAMRGGAWCLNVGDGKVLWRFPRDGRSEAMQIPQPVVAQDAARVFLANDTGAVFSLDSRSGMYDAKKKIGWKSFARPLPDSLPNEGILLRARPLLLESAAGNTANSRRDVDRSVSSFVVGGNDGGVRAFNAADGSLLWQTETGAPVSAILAAAEDGRRRVLVCNSSSGLLSMEPATGTVLTRYESRGQHFAGAVVTPRHVVGVTTDGIVHRFPLSN